MYQNCVRFFREDAISIFNIGMTLEGSRVFSGQYIEKNPINIKRLTSVEYCYDKLYTGMTQMCDID